SAANRATNAASAAQTLATTAAKAARTARDAANSAADHADAAAAAAEEAVKNAGKAIDYANKSTAHAAAAVEAANVATKAVSDAVEVEQNARAAEAQTLEQDKQQAIDEVRLLSEIEATDQATLAGKRLVAERLTQETKDLIAKAEQALGAGDMETAATTGRQAAVHLLDVSGAWTRQSAQHALAGSDDDVFAWIDLDRALAQAQDDRETTAHIASIAAPKIAEAAAAALASATDTAVGDFLTSGMKKASDDELRVAINKILNDNPGRAVKKAGNDALDENTTEALNSFFDDVYPVAVKEDDQVLANELILTGGPFTKAYAEVALEAPAWVLRNFITVVRYRTAQLDFDTATHVAAVRGAIAAAAKIAQNAQTDAATASKAAADARKAAAEAQEWAKKALDSAAKADDYAQEARDNANAADKAAADAQKSADTAKAAAATARGAARSANYSANRAIDSARSALASSASAQNSAAAARASELAASADAKAAAAAYAAAKQIAAQKHLDELRHQAKEDWEKAELERQNKQNPADNDGNDQVNPNGTKGHGDSDEWWNDAQWYADAFNVVSVGSGFLAAGCTLAGTVFPPALGAAAVFAGISGGASVISSVFTGIEHGFTSSEFFWSALDSTLSLATFGASKWLTPAKALGKSVVPEVSKITHVAGDKLSSIGKAIYTLGA
ncbi:ALF repeat-containing protein, partial [Streptomyces sp. SID11385]|uniref:ALF repeat-containing protein n=1 Tax=Streptomyces sp. SID11385 TaxID=2706031 RepID=UPI0013C7C8C1